jgi:hypothetical protein
VTQEYLQFEPLVTVDVSWDLKPPFEPCRFMFIFIIDNLCGSFVATFGYEIRARYRPLVDQVRLSLHIISSRSSVRTRRGELVYLTSRTLAQATPEKVLPKSIATAILRSCNESALIGQRVTWQVLRYGSLKRRAQKQPERIYFEKD